MNTTIPCRSLSANKQRNNNSLTMNAIALTRLPEVGHVADALELVQVPRVHPAAKEVAIRLCASAMHIDEIYAAQGTALGRFYGPKTASAEQPYIVGSSVSGVVIEVGRDIDTFSVGDEVIVIPHHQMEFGSWAKVRCVDASRVMSKPSSFTHVEAAAITMAACVAWGAIRMCKTNPGDQCLVVGASSSIGIMMVQYLKSLNCHVTAVCSGGNTALVKRFGADEVVDYTIQNFADEACAANIHYDRVFDCIGGRDIERDAIRALKRTGVFETVVGPMQYIGESKLSWLAFSGVMFYIVRRMLTSLVRGPRYMFGEKYPRFTIHDAINQAVEHDIRMPIDQSIPFERNAVVRAVHLLVSHRAKGRIVIDFEGRDT